jgi:hypothetical protein
MFDLEIKETVYTINCFGKKIEMKGITLLEWEEIAEKSKDNSSGIVRDILINKGIPSDDFKRLEPKHIDAIIKLLMPEKK